MMPLFTLMEVVSIFLLFMHVILQKTTGCETNMELTLDLSKR